MSSSEERYLEALEERARQLENKIQEQNDKLQESKFRTRFIEKKIFSLEHQLERVEKEIEDYQNEDNIEHDDSVVLGVGDKYHNRENKKIKNVEDEIEKLKELRDNIYSVHYQKVIDKKINRKEKKLARLQKRAVRVENIQRSVILKKRVVKNIKSRKFGKQEARKDYWDNKVVDKEEQIDSLDPEHSIKDQIKKMVYELQLNRYKKNQGIYNELIDDLKNGKVNILGANFIIMGKKITNIFRGNNRNNNSLNR